MRHPENLNMQKLCSTQPPIPMVGELMVSDNKALASLEEKVDKLSEELASIGKKLEELASAKDVEKSVAPLSKIETTLDKMSKSKEDKELAGKIGSLTDSLKEIDSALVEIRDSKEMEVLFKKMDDILVGVADVGNEVKSVAPSGGNNDTVVKKIDDLQQYVAGLSGLEDTVQELSGSLSETKEIVGIIVRQLDDLERKYNQSLEKMTEAVEIAASLPERTSEESAEKDAKKPAKKPPKEKEPPPKPKPVKVTPSAIDDIMDSLLDMVTPQTEAKEMAGALEEVRDELTQMIKGHTPVLFQFGKKARELKSYPPTATLNENDIASLNTEIRSWTSKLKEIAKADD
jgi:chromosome segregation ATPase